jgi:hypothetical protein
VGHGGEGAVADAEVELQRGVQHVAVVDARVVELDGLVHVVGVVDEATERVGLVHARHDEVERARGQVVHRDAEVAAEVVARLEHEARPRRQAFDRVHRLVQEYVVQEAVGLVVVDRGAITGTAAERAADSELAANRVLVAVASLHGRLELVGGIQGRDDDRAADGIAAVEGALRSFQDLDLLDVVELLVELRGVRLQHAVHLHGDRGLAVPCLGDAADDDEGVARVLGLYQRHVRHHLDEVRRPVDAGVLDQRLGEHVDRHWHVLEGLVALAGRDDDLLHFRALRHGRQRHRGGEDRSHRRRKARSLGCEHESLRVKNSIAT